MKQRRFLRVIAGIFFLVFLTVSALAQEQKIILRCADVHSFGYPTIEGVLYMARLVKERTGGRVEIVVYPGGRLGSEQSVVEMLKIGALDMGRISVSEAAEVSPRLGVFVLPYLFKDDEHKWRVLEGKVGEDLLQGLGKVGLVGLCFQEAGYRSFYNSKRPIYQPDDLKGLKIRVQPSQNMLKMVEFLGALAVPINYNEVYSALAAGVIDGAENNLPSYLTSGHYKMARYVSLDRHSSIPEVVLFSWKNWQRLSPAVQQVILTAAKESVQFQRQKWVEFEVASRKKLEAEGCYFNDVDITAFKERLKPYYQKYAVEYESLVREIQSIN